jgi:hypothetical protein
MKWNDMREKLRKAFLRGISTLSNEINDRRRIECSTAHPLDPAAFNVIISHHQSAAGPRGGWGIARSPCVFLFIRKVVLQPLLIG